MVQAVEENPTATDAPQASLVQISEEPTAPATSEAVADEVLAVPEDGLPENREVAHLAVPEEAAAQAQESAGPLVVVQVCLGPLGSI